MQRQACNLEQRHFPGQGGRMHAHGLPSTTQMRAAPKVRACSSSMPLKQRVLKPGCLGLKFTKSTRRGTWTAATGAVWQVERRTAEASVHTTAATSPSESESEPPAFNWTQNWWPLLSEEMLHRDKPNAVMLLGRELVVWWNEVESQWVVMQDRCPHRLTPLSQGRIKPGGTLTCSYHGWSFNSQGTCTSIPQLDRPAPGSAAQEAAAATGTAKPTPPLMRSKKTCVRTYPSQLVQGLLFTWLDDSPEGLERSKVQAAAVEGTGKAKWMVIQVDNDFEFSLQQPMDPTHANFLHEGMFSHQSEHAVPIDMRLTLPVTAGGGFAVEHGGYEHRNIGMKAVRELKPPGLCRVSYTYPSGSCIDFSLFAVPVAPGVSRIAAKIDMKPAPAAAAGNSKGSGFNPLSKLMAQLAGRMPHWVNLRSLLQDQHQLQDQDTVLIHLTEQAMVTAAATDKDYTLLASSDAGILSVYSWLRKSGYAQLWGSSGAAPRQFLKLEQLLDRGRRHVDHCAVCQKGLRTMERVCNVLRALAFSLSAASAGLCAVALFRLDNMYAVGSAVVCTLLAGGLLALLNAAETFKQGRFISGMPSWVKAGGLSQAPPR